MNKYNEILPANYSTENSDNYGHDAYINDNTGTVNHDGNIIQQGGDNSSVSVPNGGFPPIYICNSQKQKKEITSVRAYGENTNKTAVSISDIMKNRRNKT